MTVLLDNQIGYADEATYGTRVAPTVTLEYNTESLERVVNYRSSAGMRKGNAVQRGDRESLVSKGASGSVNHDLAFEGFAKLLKHLFGKAPTTSQPSAVPDPTVYEHLYTIDDTTKSMTVQVGRPGVLGTVHPFDYVGCKVAQGSLSQSLDEYLKLDAQLDAQDEKSDQTLVVAAYPTAQELLHDGMWTVTVNGTPFDPKSGSLQLVRGLALDRYFARISSLKKEPIRAGLSPVTGTLEGEFEDLTTYNLFKAGTLVPIVFDWLGSTISNTYKRQLTITMAACRLMGPKPSTAGPGVLPASTPFEVRNNGTDPAVSVLLRTTDATA